MMLLLFRFALISSFDRIAEAKKEFQWTLQVGAILLGPSKVQEKAFLKEGRGTGVYGQGLLVLSRLAGGVSGGRGVGTKRCYGFIKD